MKDRESVNLNINDEGTMLADMIAAKIRECSEAGTLIAERELEQHFVEQKRTMGDDGIADFSNTLADALKRYDDLHELKAVDTAHCYFSSQNMTRAYALMLLERHDDPLQLIAEVVRENSAAYPRPLPFEIFTHSPFDMTLDEVQDCLRQMAADQKYSDIASTTTSASTMYLYSTLHLEADHASMLAEWFDVGQFENP
jgi:hypothetical protein